LTSAKLRVPLACLLLAGALSSAAAQAPAARAAALLEAPLRHGAGDALLEDILGSELEAMLVKEGIRVQGKRLALPQGGDQAGLPEEERISHLLAGVDARGADFIVVAFYLAEGEELTIQFALYDPAVKIVLGGTLSRARKGLTTFASVAAAVGAFEPAVKRYVEGGYRTDPPSGLVERVVVTGPQDGSRVVIVDRDFGSVSGGRLVIPYTQYPIGTIVPVSVTKDGYHSYSANLKLADPQSNLELPPLRRETRADLSLRWSYGLATGVGFGARFHLEPDTLFLGVEAYRTFDYASLSTHMVRHYDLGVNVGRYVVFPYSSFFRINVSAGVGMIVSDVEGIAGREYTDYYVSVGDPTAEFRLGRVILFARPDIHFALGVGYNLLGREWIRTPYGLPPMTAGMRLSW
jgi:hypothetical protein